MSPGSLAALAGRILVEAVGPRILLTSRDLERIQRYVDQDKSGWDELLETPAEALSPGEIGRRAKIERTEREIVRLLREKVMRPVYGEVVPVEFAEHSGRDFFAVDPETFEVITEPEKFGGFSEAEVAALAGLHAHGYFWDGGLSARAYHDKGNGRRKIVVSRHVGSVVELIDTIGLHEPGHFLMFGGDTPTSANYESAEKPEASTVEEQAICYFAERRLSALAKRKRDLAEPLRDYLEKLSETYGLHRDYFERIRNAAGRKERAALALAFVEEVRERFPEHYGCFLHEIEKEDGPRIPGKVIAYLAWTSSYYNDGAYRNPIERFYERTRGRPRRFAEWIGSCLTRGELRDSEVAIGLAELGDLRRSQAYGGDPSPTRRIDRPVRAPR